MAVKHVGLGSAQLPLVAAAGRGKCDPVGVPAAGFLGERKRGADVAAGDARQEVLLSRVVATRDERCRREDDRGEVRRTQQRAARLLQNDAHLDEAVAGTAVLLGDGEAGQAEFARQLRPHVRVVTLGSFHETPDFGFRRKILQEVTHGAA